MRNASVPKNEKSLVLARAQVTLASPAAAKRLRRLFESRGNSARQDVLIAAGVAVLSDKESEHAAWIAYCKAREGANIPMNEEGVKKGENNRKRDGRILKGFNC